MTEQRRDRKSRRRAQWKDHFTTIRGTKLSQNGILQLQEVSIHCTILNRKDRKPDRFHHWGRWKESGERGKKRGGWERDKKEISQEGTRKTSKNETATTQAPPRERTRLGSNPYREHIPAPAFLRLAELESSYKFTCPRHDWMLIRWWYPIMPSISRSSKRDIQQHYCKESRSAPSN